ncbi:MAG: SusC/RagA family TonB-linked outer membrane protein [Niabella sp.]
MRKILLLQAILMSFSFLSFAQTEIVNGSVIDETGAAVPFATISVKGNNTAVSANEQGKFTINVPADGILVFTATGFSQVEMKPVGSDITVTMKRAGQTIEEVVVTALGVRRTRNTVPYAAQQVQGSEVAGLRTSNFAQGLSGRVSGLEIRQGNTMGSSTNIVLRGTKTIGTSNQALFVVDGVPMNNDNLKSDGQASATGGYDYGSAITDINPDDIETMTVLKGAASTALYGSRGGNGVILITTKKAKRGLGITLNSSIGIGKYDPSTFAKYQNKYGQGYGEYYEDETGHFLYRDPDDGYSNAYTTDADGNIVGWLSTGRLVAPMSEDASYGARFDPSLMVYQWDAFDVTSPYYNQARPWVVGTNGPASIFQTAVSSNQSIYIDGASDKGSFKLGYTRTDDKGIMPNSNIKRNLINTGGTYNITDKLTAGVSVNFANQQGRGRYGSGYDDKNLMTNFRQWYAMNVDIQEQKAAYSRTKQNITWNWADPTDITPIYWDNPYFTRYENYETDQRNRVYGNINLNYKISNAINVLGRASLDTYNELIEERQAKGSVTTSSYSRLDRKVSESNYDLMFNLDKDLNDKLNLKALLGTNVRLNNGYSNYAITNGGLIIERLYTLANSVNAINPPVSTKPEKQVWGNFAGATLVYNDMLTLDATLRNDQSSTLPKGNNAYWYYSGSFGFTFSELIADKSVVNYGKFRANYATAGNDTDPFQTYNYYTLNSTFNGLPLAGVPANYNSPNLRPERTQSYEFGLEMSFIQNRFGFDVSYYNAKTFDQLFPVPVSQSTGFANYFVNAGNVRNKGIETSVYLTPVRNPDFSWTLNANWTRNRNKVEELTEGIDNIVLGNFQGGVTLNAELGKPYGVIKGTDFVYVNGQRVVDQSNGRYLNTSSASENIGNVNPDWIGGITNTFKYKNISLSALIDMRQGGDVFSLDMYYGLATGLYPETAGLNDKGNETRLPVSEGGGIILPGVDPDGNPNAVYAENVNYGLFGYARQPNKAFVYDASYIKLRDVTLTYSFPSKVFKKVLKGLDLSLIGRNLWIIHKNLPYADPEDFMSSGNLQGYQTGAYPSVRTFTFNVKARF